MAARLQSKRGRNAVRRSPVMAVLHGLYLFLVVLSTLIVVLWCAFRLLVKPPALASPTPPADTPTVPPGPSAPAVQSGLASTEPTQTPEPEPQRKGDWYQTFLLVGTDDGNGNADTIMVASFDTKNDKVGVISIPRDTLVDEPRKVKKINGAYGAGGVDELMREASELVGFPIDHYVKVDIAAFVAIVDQVNGGISFYVPCDMYHNDGAGFIIDLKKGTQWLSGQQALQLVRYRGYADADLGRIHTQQKFLTEMAKQTLRPANLGKLPAFVDIFNRYVKTDLSATDILYYATQALEVDMTTGVSFATLPGDGEVTYDGIPYYYQLYPQETLDLFNRLINPYTTDLTMDMVEIFQAQ